MCCRKNSLELKKGGVDEERLTNEREREGERGDGTVSSLAIQINVGMKMRESK